LLRIKFNDGIIFPCRLDLCYLHHVMRLLNDLHLKNLSFLTNVILRVLKLLCCLGVSYSWKV
jgi:hypothetical protein